MRETVILEPLDENIDEYKQMYKDIKMKINELHKVEDVEDMTFDAFLTDFLKISYEDYILAIRSELSGVKVFLREDPQKCVSIHT